MAVLLKGQLFEEVGTLIGEIVEQANHEKMDNEYYGKYLNLLDNEGGYLEYPLENLMWDMVYVTGTIVEMAETVDEQKYVKGDKEVLHKLVESYFLSRALQAVKQVKVNVA